MHRLLASLFVCASLLWNPASAGTITLNWVDSGWYINSGFHANINTNYLAGFCPAPSCVGVDADATHHNFFVFDTRAVAGSVTSGVLRLRNGNVPQPGIYSLFDVVTPVRTLVGSHFNSLDIYEDLGSGVRYGSATLPYSVVTTPTLTDIVLNDSAIAAINAAPDFFALGGSFSGGLWAFGRTNTDEERQLILEVSNVPEPASIPLLAAGLAGLALARRRHG